MEFLRRKRDVSLVLGLASAVILLRLGTRLSHNFFDLGSWTGFVILSLVYLSAIGLIVLSVTDYSPGRAWGYILVLLVFAGVFTGFAAGNVEPYTADIMLFSHYSADLLMNGTNPYTASLEPAFDAYDGTSYGTLMFSGEVVDSLSYPALSFLVFVPQALVFEGPLGATVMFFLMASILFLVRESPEELALAPFVIVFGSSQMFTLSLNSGFEAVWVLPVLLSIKYWFDDRLKVSGLFLGLAFAVKQIPWFIAPFLAVWLYREYALEDFYDFAGAGFLGFMVPNAVFIIWNPVAWIKGVLTPLGADGALYSQGVGLPLLNTLGITSLPNVYFTVAMLMSIAVLLVLYYLRFEKLKHTAWVLPAVILWFNYRSFNNYFLFFTLIGYYVYTRRYDVEES